ncbi:uncharacterized protein PG998_010057 [Apiospora kogelbergensis]|uniref:uncharacterized protein n=1 Tax=Apiospora kogelbergensis TaxID=1337665 RepID=UPI003131C5E8
MAEALGIASGAAGLTSLVIQVASGTSRLRKAYKLTKMVPVEVDIISRDLDFICEVARRLNCTTGQTNQADLIVVYCRSSIQAVVEALNELSQKASRMAARNSLNTSVQRLKWMPSCQEDLESLRKLVQDAKQNLMLLGQLGMIQPPVSPPLLPPALHTQDSNNDGPSSGIQNKSTHTYSLVSRGRGRKSCLKRRCACRCHIEGSVGGRFWAFKYTPLSMILGECDVPKCDGRQHIYSLRVALSQLGFPLTVTAAIHIQSDAAGRSFGVSLRPQYVVRYTSPGFETLHKLGHGYITIDEASSKFTEMCRKDPSFIHQVNPAEQGYIEVLVGIARYRNIPYDAFVSLLRLFIDDLGMRQGLDSVNCMQCLWVFREAYLGVFDALVSLGFDPLSLENPHRYRRQWNWTFLVFKGWYQSDLFFVKLIEKLILLDPEFGNTSSIQYDIILYPGKALNTLSHGPEELDVTPNFLGQTPLHLAIALGNTELTRALNPLDYTALLGNTSCAKILLLAWAGIDRSSQEIMLTVGNPTFLTFALFPYKRNFVFEVLQYIQETFRDDKDRFISSASANRVLGDMAYHGNRYNDNTQALLPFTCDDISRMIDMVDDVNSEFSSENGSVRFRLLELYWPLEHAQHIIRRGYRGLDSKVVATAASVDRMDHVEDFELDDLRSTWLGHISKFYEGYLAMYGLPCSKDVLSAYAYYPNDRFMLPIPKGLHHPPERPIIKLLTYVIELEREVIIQQPVNKHQDLAEWYGRRMSWVLDLADMLEIPMPCLQKAVRRACRDQVDSDPVAVPLMMSHFIDTTNKRLAERLA